jgi:glycosyltransferase involved in cell wall biosynthesis
MRIAVLNWRDRAHPQSGGAEIFIDEVSRRWAGAGHEVSVYCSKSPHLNPYDSDGPLAITRVGNLRSGTHHLLAPRLLERAPRPDVVLESINTIPYALPLRLGQLPPFVPLVHQLAKDVWKAHLPTSAAYVAERVEPWLYRPYRKEAMLAVSESTAADLRSVGIHKVTVLPQGGLGQQEPPDKESDPTFIFVGRLAPNKRPDHALEAFKLIKEQLPAAHFWIVGDGQMRETILNRLPEGAKMLGRLSRSELLQRLGRAHLLFVTSIREGWGLVVTEANALGTPAVAYDVPGLRDSVRTGETGLLVSETPAALASAAWRLISRPEQYGIMRKEAIEWGSSCSWDRTADVLLTHLHMAASQNSKTQHILHSSRTPSTVPGTHQRRDQPCN